MLENMLWWLRWVTAGAIGVALTVWLAAVSFALFGFRATAEGITAALWVILPATAALLLLLAVCFLLAVVVRWLASRDNTPTR